MGHYTAPLLPPRVVAGLIGLSPASLRRWDAALLPGAAKRPRRYSWAEVETLQRALHHASGRGGTPAAFKGAAADGDPARGRLPAGRTAPARRGSRRGVVPVALPRSARRRDRARRH